MDYHWDGDLEEKQRELVVLFTRRLLPDIKRRLGHDGDAQSAAGPDAPSPAVRIVELAFWRPGVANSRIELPVEITHIICLDPPAVRTADGVVYPTASDADLIESKVIALLNRRFIEHRDFCDIFLFANHLTAHAAQRLQTKLAQLGMSPDAIEQRLRNFREARDYHIRSIDAVIGEQLDPVPAASIVAAGGGSLVLDAVLEVLTTKLNLPGGKA